MGQGRRRWLAGLVLWSFAGLATAASLNEQFEVRPADVHRALPDEIEAMGAQLTELAAGFWESAKASPPRLFLAVAVANRSTEPLGLAPFGLLIRTQQGTQAVTFECSPERGQASAVLLPAHQADFLCRAESPTDFPASNLAGVLAQLRAKPELMQIQSRGWQARPVLPAPTRPEPAPARAEPLRRAVQPGVDPSPAAIMPRTETPRTTRQDNRSFDTRLFTSGKFQFFLLLVLAVGYYGFAKMIGNLRAAILLWFLGTVYAVLVIAGAPSAFYRGWEGLGALIVYGIMLCIPPVLAYVFFVLFEFVSSDWETIKKRIVHLLLGLIGLALVVLLGRMGS